MDVAVLRLGVPRAEPHVLRYAGSVQVEKLVGRGGFCRKGGMKSWAAATASACVSCDCRKTLVLVVVVVAFKRVMSWLMEKHKFDLPTFETVVTTTSR